MSTGPLPAQAHAAGLTDAERRELLDWASACQSAYHIENTPGHRFGGLQGSLDDNRRALCEYVERLLAGRSALAAPACHGPTEVQEREWFMLWCRAHLTASQCQTITESMTRGESTSWRIWLASAERLTRSALAGSSAPAPGCQAADEAHFRGITEGLRMAAESAKVEEELSHPPCAECGAMTEEEAGRKCHGGGDKDDCHGCQLWAGHAPVTLPREATEPAGAVRDVLDERRRQVEVEGWTPEHDDTHTQSELALAAASYAMAAAGYAKGHIPPIWPWSPAWWKPAYARKDLVRACALILAEIERRDRAVAAKGGGASP